MSRIVVDIGADYSRYPAGRHPSDGKFNGETFRKKFLTEHLKTGHEVLVNLDKSIDFGSSFLEEAFAGLIREDGIEMPVLKRLLAFETKKHPFIPAEIWSYIEDEARQHTK